MEDSFSKDGVRGVGGRGDGSGSNASSGERQMKLHSLACPSLTSCSVAGFLTGLRPVHVHGAEVGDTCSNPIAISHNINSEGEERDFP